jgi:NAD(P)-dependent dehydrogenase (short-subunit alcohol dehydrogenase family)
MRFTGKTAIVTGAAQGIGEAYAKALAAEGANVVVADMNVEGAEGVAAAICSSGGSAKALSVNVAEPESAQAMADATLAEFGGIDALVNNAAIYGDMALQPLMSVEPDYYRRFMEVNVNGALWCTRACSAALADGGGGAIVNQSSVAAWMPSGFYSISKAAVNALTASLATELARKNIRVNAIAPGFIDTAATRKITPEKMLDGMTKQTAMKRLGTTDDLVGLVLFMLSDQASYMTGQIVAVDGGLVTRL